MPEAIPLSVRAIFVLSVLSVLSWLDLRRHRRLGSSDRRTRRLVYATVLCCGICGAVFGVLMDQVTCTISPEYFRLFKELPADSPIELRLRAADLGFAAGTLPGLIAGVCLAGAAVIRIESTDLRLRQTVTYLAVPLVMFFPLAAGLAWYEVRHDPVGMRRTFRHGLSSGQVSRMIAVGGIHQAAYLSGLLGTVTATVLLRKRLETDIFASGVDIDGLPPTIDNRLDKDRISKS